MDELQRLIWEGENDSVDFKQRITKPEKIARTMVSFANTHGGIILVGVKDNGYVTGVDPEEEKHTLQLAANFYCNPPVKVEYEEIEQDDRVVLKVTVPESIHKPHFAKLSEDDWRGYVRVKDTSVQASKMSHKAVPEDPEQFAQLPLNQHEEAVLTYLRLHPRITLHQFMKQEKLTERRAYHILVKLVIHGYILLHEKEIEPYYTLSKKLR